MTEANLKLNTIKWTIVRWWGMLFRTAFILSIGFFGFIFYKPIGDIPFSQLTLNQVFSNLFATIIVLGSIFWFFNFPNEKHFDLLENQKQSPYAIWGQFGGIVICIAALISWMIWTFFILT